MRFLSLSVIAVALLSVVGCGSSDAPELVAAYGKVTLDGAPLPNARVTFVHEKGSPAGNTNEGGSFTIDYNDGMAGAFPGPTTVVVKQMNPAEFKDDPEADDEDDDPDYEAKEAAQAKKPLGEWNINLDVGDDTAPFNLDLKSEDAISPDSSEN